MKNFWLKLRYKIDNDLCVVESAKIVLTYITESGYNICSSVNINLPLNKQYFYRANSWNSEIKMEQKLLFEYTNYIKDIAKKGLKKRRQNIIVDLYKGELKSGNYIVRVDYDVDIKTRPVTFEEFLQQDGKI